MSEYFDFGDQLSGEDITLQQRLIQQFAVPLLNEEHGIYNDPVKLVQPVHGEYANYDWRLFAQEKPAPGDRPLYRIECKQDKHDNLNACIELAILKGHASSRRFDGTPAVEKLKQVYELLVRHQLGDETEFSKVGLALDPSLGEFHYLLYIHTAKKRVCLYDSKKLAAAVRHQLSHTPNLYAANNLDKNTGSLWHGVGALVTPETIASTPSFKAALLGESVYL